MNISIDSSNAWTVIAASGDIDLHCSADFCREMISRLDAGEPILVDMSQVSYIDSSGIASLAQGLKRAREKDLKLALVQPGEAVMRILRLTKLDSVFPIFDSVGDAPDD